LSFPSSTIVLCSKERGGRGGGTCPTGVSGPAAQIIFGISLKVIGKKGEKGTGLAETLCKR